MAYDLVQSVFLMNMAANGVASYINTQPMLQTYLLNYLNGGSDPMRGTFKGFFPSLNSGSNSLIDGNWSVVWGPGVCLKPNMVSGEAANAMYVAYSPSQNKYVVAIAATNPASTYDWMSEDADVAPKFMAKWPPTLPFVRESNDPPLGNSGPAISAATALGLSNLLTDPGMRDPKTNTTLAEFLQQLPQNKSLWKKDAIIIFTGHSLAGALSPTLAFYLRNYGTGDRLNHFKDVWVLPTAGATPGNDQFAAKWNAAFLPPATGSKTIENWNTDIASKNDIVPHAWDQLSGWVKLLITDPTQYDSPWGKIILELGAILISLQTAAVNRAAGGKYTKLNQNVLSPTETAYQWTFDFSGNQWNYPPKLVPFPIATKANQSAALMTSVLSLRQPMCISTMVCLT